jgi:DNA-binding LacI/PurR family transcriptional regulator
MSTIREIARELNLSHTTVSRVLNSRNEQTISPATRDRIWAAARDMGYQPNAAARALATGRSHTVALLMPYLYSAFHAEVVYEVEQALRRSGYQVLVATIDWSNPTEQGGFHLLPAPVDGYLALETASFVSPLLAATRAGSGRSVPAVAMGGRNIEEGSDYIGFDLTAGAGMAMEHLLRIGRRKIAFVGEKPRGMRYTRYREVMQREGLAELIIEVPAQRRAPARDAVRRYFSALEVSQRPDALFCFNDEICIGAYRGLRDLKIGIGDDVALIGFDGIEDCEYLDTPLTTVSLPIRDMCRQAWEALEKRLEDPSAPPVRKMLPPTLIVRESTVPYPLDERG